MHAATLERQSPCPMLEPPVRAFPVFTAHPCVGRCECAVGRRDGRRQSWECGQRQYAIRTPTTASPNPTGQMVAVCVRPICLIDDEAKPFQSSRRMTDWQTSLTSGFGRACPYDRAETAPRAVWGRWSPPPAPRPQRLRSCLRSEKSLCLPRIRTRRLCKNAYVCNRQYVCGECGTNQPTSGGLECAEWGTNQPTQGPECVMGGSLVKPSGAG